jgi:hypothetical protein
MFKAITTSLFIAAVGAGSAQAEEIRVSVVGKDPAAVRADIRAAAAGVCRPALGETPSPIELNPELNCRRRAIRAAEAEWRAIELARSRTEQLAAR